MRNRRRNSPDIAITKSSDEVLAINECFELLNATGLIHSDDVVVITPNWVQKQRPETGIVVGTESLRAILQFVKKQNPKRIVVATGSGQRDTSEIMKFSGFDKIIEEEGVEFVDLNHGPFSRVDLNHNIVKSTNINNLFHEMTFLMSFTQLKHHEEATMSAAIKNIALSWPPAEEHGFPKKNLGIHDELHEFISAMAETVPIDLAIVSASPAMIGTGPAKGVPRHTGLVLAGTDPIAVDTIAARLLGFKPQGVRYLFECSKKNIGTSDISKMSIRGLDLKKAEEEFSYGVYQEKVVID